MTLTITTKCGHDVEVPDLHIKGAFKYVNHWENREYQELPRIECIQDRNGYDIDDMENEIRKFLELCDAMFTASAPELDAVDYTRGGMDIMTAAKEKAEEAMMGEAK